MSNHHLFLGQSQRKSNFHNLSARIGLAAIILMFVISLIGMNCSIASAAGVTYYVNNTVACSESGPGAARNRSAQSGKAPNGSRRRYREGCSRHLR